MSTGPADAPMTPPRHGPATRLLVAGVVLLVAGGVALIARFLVGRYERHSFLDGQPPPRYVSVHAGRTYWISVPGGVRAEQEIGLPPSALQCSAQQRNGPELNLQVNREATDTKLVNGIASFQAPVTGSVHISCAGLSDVYVDSLSGADPAGVLLLLGTVLLAVGAPLVLAGARARSLRSSPVV